MEKDKDYCFTDYSFKKEDLPINNHKNFVNVPIILNGVAIGMVTDSKIDKQQVMLRVMLFKKLCKDLKPSHPKTIEWIEYEDCVQPISIIIEEIQEVEM